MIFGIKEKSIILTHTMYVGIATNILVLLVLWSRVKYICRIYPFAFIFGRKKNHDFPLLFQEFFMLHVNGI